MCELGKQELGDKGDSGFFCIPSAPFEGQEAGFPEISTGRLPEGAVSAKAISPRGGHDHLFSVGKMGEPMVGGF